MRGSLPLGVDVADAAGLAVDLEVVRARLLRAVQEAPVSEVAGRMATRRRTLPARRAGRAAGPAADRRPSRATPLLTLRPHLAARLETRADGSGVLRSRAGDLRLAADGGRRRAGVLEGDPTTAGELGGDLARRLLLAGVVVAG